MTEPTEDIPYQVDDFATEDEPNNTPDVDQANKSVLVEIQQYLKEAIVEHDSVDQIDLTEQAKMTPTQQIAVHKLVKSHLQNIKSTIDTKLKELA